MPGLKTNTMSHKEVLEAMRNLAPALDFVWDGVDEDDRPATEEELRAGTDAYRKQRGHPVSPLNLAS